MIATDLSKQQALDADPRTIQQINFTANVDPRGNTTRFFIIEEAKETVLVFPQGTVKVLWAPLRRMQLSWMQFYWIQSTV